MKHNFAIFISTMQIISFSVLVCGGNGEGNDGTSCDIYNVAKNEWTTTGHMKKVHVQFSLLKFNNTVSCAL